MKLPIIVELPENVKDDKDNEVENIMFAMMTYDLYKLIVLVQVEDEESMKNLAKNYVKKNEDNDEEVIDTIYNDDDVCDSMTKAP